MIAQDGIQVCVCLFGVPSVGTCRGGEHRGTTPEDAGLSDLRPTRLRAQQAPQATASLGATKDCPYSATGASSGGQDFPDVWKISPHEPGAFPRPGPAASCSRWAERRALRAGTPPMKKAPSWAEASRLPANDSRC
jgi:hypothetical protein